MQRQETEHLSVDRSQILSGLLHRVGGRLGIAINRIAHLPERTPGTVVPHPYLRTLLLSDPAMAALLPFSPVNIALGTLGDRPFVVASGTMIQVSPYLLDAPAGLAAAVRWGVELASLVDNMGASEAEVLIALKSAWLHGQALVAALPDDDRAYLADLLPADIAKALDDGAFSAPVLAWLARRHHALAPRAGALAKAFDDHPDDLDMGGVGAALALPMERQLVSFGDTRLAVDPATGFNRYGTVPRPRPEAVHFSSSTASSISDYGFALCDAIRRAGVIFCRGDDVRGRRLSDRFIDAVGGELLAMFGLTEDEADVILAPSGTDTELLAVLFALSAEGGKDLLNILVAPEETGRGVVLAGQGRYFDDLGIAGIPVEKGTEVWPHRSSETESVPIRDTAGHARPAADIAADIRTCAASARIHGRRVLQHVVIASKTGLDAPSPDFLDDLLAAEGDNMDVVVDACQFRTAPRALGDLVRAGHMVQVTGSKFFTGPPFSGALVVPAALRSRLETVAALLGAAPAASHSGSWSAWWRRRLPVMEGPVFAFGSALRWIPAFAEEQMFSNLPLERKRDDLRRAQETLVSRLEASRHFSVLEQDLVDLRDQDASDGLSYAHSIVCFSVLDGLGHGLTAGQCQELFTLLNADMSGRFDNLSRPDRVLLRQAAHIGQAVELRAETADAPAVLRFVIGARYFTTVGFSGDQSQEASRQSEIADALRAIEKLERLVMLLYPATQV
ncbi:MAG: hypothetical protein KDE22_08650 [Rhodobacterales bacterium]|nr:hypothetical protein [Rhodobacterales bacterium]